jgi:hypothetical protein
VGLECTLAPDSDLRQHVRRLRGVKGVRDLPTALLELGFGNSFTQRLQADVLPEGLRTLTFGRDCYQLR